MTGDWRKLRNECGDLYSPIFVGYHFKNEKRGACRALVVKPKGNTPPEVT
jgi:hypothetical protein